jgi:hypothetical protein
MLVLMLLVLSTDYTDYSDKGGVLFLKSKVFFVLSVSPWRVFHSRISPLRHGEHEDDSNQTEIRVPPR